MVVVLVVLVVVVGGGLVIWVALTGMRSRLESCRTQSSAFLNCKTISLAESKQVAGNETLAANLI